MKKKIFQFWRKIEYGDRTKFKFWSLKVKGEGDKNLAKKTPMRKWRKIIILNPIGELETVFSIGYSDIFGNTKICNAKRRVGQAYFGMRMGPEDCEFFIVSNYGEVELEFIKYVDIKDLSYSNYSLY